MLNSHAVRAIKNRQAIITQDDAPVYTQGKYSVYFDENEKKYLVFLSGEPRAIAAAESLSGAKDRIKEDKDRYANNKYNPYNTHDAKNLADLPDVKYKGYLISLNAYGEYFVSRNNHGNWQPIPNAKFGNENKAKSYIDTLPKVTTDRKSNLHPRWRKSGDKAAIRKIKDCLMGIKKTRDAASEEQIKKDFSEKKISSMEAAKKLTEIGYSKSDALITVSLWSKGKYYQGKVTDQIIKGFMIYKSGKSPNTYYAKNENGEEYDGTMEEIKKKIDAYWMKRDEDVMKQKVRDEQPIFTEKGYKVYEETGGKFIVFAPHVNRAIGSAHSLNEAKRIIKEDREKYSSTTWKDKIPNPRFKIKDDKIFRLRSAVKKMKDALVSVRQNMSTKKVEYKVGGQWKPIEGKVKTAYENEQIKYDYADGGYHYFTCEVKDSKTKDSTQYTISWMEDGEKESVTLPAVELLKYDANPRKAAVEYLAEKHPDGKVLNVTGDSTGAFIKGELETKDAALSIVKQGNKYRLIGAIKEQELADLNNKGFNEYQEALNAMKKYNYSIYGQETTDDLFYKGTYYKPQELHALLIKEGMTKKLNELTESEKRDRKGNAWPLYESNGGVFAVVN